MGGQVLIHCLPVSYKFWHRLGILEHGLMEHPAYAYGVFTEHFGRVQFARRFTKWVGLELGPGDSLSSAVIAAAFGASAYYLIDSGDFAQKDLNIYTKMAAFLQQKGLSAPKLDHLTSIQDVLKTCNATYGTAGIASLRAIPTESVDFVWSHGVLQSVRRAEFFDYLLELRRILRGDGACSHRVPLNDLSRGALNHLRLDEALWESNFIARCGFYTNRYRYSKMLIMFQKAGFQVDVVRVLRWDRLPTSRRKLASQFRAMSEEELQIYGFDVVLTPA